MKTKLIDKKENVIFKREEVKFEIDHFGEKTPDRKTIITEAIKLLKKDESLIVLKKANTVYGEPKTIISINVYKNRKDLEANEPKYIIKRNTFKKEETAPAAEEKPVEAPKEEKKEEVKPEEEKKEEVKE